MGNRVKIISCILLILIVCACGEKVKLRDGKEYIADHKIDIIYKNEYNDKGKLKKVIETDRTYFFDSKGEISEEIFPYKYRGHEMLTNAITDEYERLYFYDDRDSLRLSRFFFVEAEDNKKIQHELFYTDSTITKIGYTEGMSDTLMHSHKKTDMDGHIVEILYQKKSFDPIRNKSDIIREKTIYTRDKHGNLSSKKINLIDNTETSMYRKEKKDNDIIITETYDERHQLLFRDKKYDSKEYIIEVTEYFGEYPAVDSVFYKNNKEVKAVKMDPDKKRESFFEYDQYGNITKSEEFVYMTKEAREKQNKEWGMGPYQYRDEKLHISYMALTD